MPDNEINKAILAKTIDDKVNFIYPKTSADIVDFDENTSVEEKIKSMENELSNGYYTKSQIDDIVNGLQNMYDDIDDTEF